jgi:hypothetical protein
MAVADGYDAVSLYDYGSGLTNLEILSGPQPFSTLADTGEWIASQGALKSPLAVIPVAQDGWDPRPNQPPTPVIFWANRTPADLSAFVQGTITLAESNVRVRPEPSPAPPMVILQAWNELLQGSMLVPTAGDGTSFGDAIGAMLSSPSTQLRSVLAVNDSGAADPNRNASGTLVDANGTAMAGATVTVSHTPTSGTYGQNQLSGQAPANAVKAAVGFRISKDFPDTWPGFWFAGPEASDISLYQISYVQPADGIQRVANGDFSSGSQSWTLQGQSQIAASDRGAGQMVQVIAEKSQAAMLDSAPFTITGGSAFQVSFAARIPPASSASGYFILYFMDAAGNILPIPGPNSEDLKSETIPFSPGEVSLGSAITDATGHYQLSLTGAGTEPLILEATYGGDAEHWPAYARVGP